MPKYNVRITMVETCDLEIVAATAADAERQAREWRDLKFDVESVRYRAVPVLQLPNSKQTS